MRVPRLGRGPGMLAPAMRLILGTALALGGCSWTPSTVPSAAGSPPAHTYTICPPGTDPPSQAATNRAESVLRKRLESLGVEPTSFTVGRCIEVTVPAGSRSLDAALLGAGDVRLIHVPQEALGTVVAGRPIPNGLEVLLRPEGIESALLEAGSDGRPTLQIRFTEQGGVAMRAWTTAHVGELLAIVVDGVAVAVPTVSEPFGRDVSVALATDSGFPADALAAILASGPLPLEWAQPEGPQG